MLSQAWRRRTRSTTAWLRQPFSARDDRRFHFIDDLRGLAAAGVAASHLLDHVPLVPVVAEQGRFGVEVFFVISGFVMAHSIGERAVSPGFAGRFLLRRSIRLDPVYWVAMAVTLAVWAVIDWQPLRGPGDVAINAVYLQDLLEAPRVVSVAWTLALELQFYLCFIALMGLCQAVSQRGPSLGRVQVVVFAASALASSAVYSLWATSPAIEAVANVAGLFTPYWFMFALGVLIEWVHRRRLSPLVFGAVLVAVVVADIAARPGPLIPSDDLSGVVAGGVAVVVYLASRTSLLRRGLGSATIAYLGRISYSLYLIHPIIGQTFIDRTHHRFGGGPVIAIVATAAGVAVSVAAAHLLYLTVEAPAVRLSGRFKPSAPPPVSLEEPATIQLDPSPGSASSTGGIDLRSTDREPEDAPPARDRTGTRSGP